MDKRITFNEDVENYDKWRPRYCKVLFDDIIQYSELNKNKKSDRSWNWYWSSNFAVSGNGV